MIRFFFAGMFLFNAVPHLTMGISGKTHMTPFKRVSSPILNIVWAFSNIVPGLLILGINQDMRIHSLTGNEIWVFLIGGLVMSLMNASLFGNPHAKLPWHKD
jgi:hypothetical protein